MNEIDITLAPPLEGFTILTDVPHDQIEACVVNWEARNQDNLTAQSLVDYINSKTGMTGNTAKLKQDEQSK